MAETQPRRFDADAINRATDLVNLVSRYVELKKRGREYVGLCVAHPDKNPSMRVVADKGFVYCHSCGFQADAIGFLMHMEQLCFTAACERLSGGELPAQKPMPQSMLRKPPERITGTPPAGIPPPNMVIPGIGGAPSTVWTYRSTDGAPLFYVARYEQPDGKKGIRCFTWGHYGEAAPEWACRHYAAPRPLYGLDRLAAKPEAQVVIVEGEKAADAAQTLFPDAACITWPGGAQAISYADLSPLQGRQCVLIPDNDEPGRQAMLRLKNRLQHIGNTQIRGVKTATYMRDGVEVDAPVGWDLADGLANGWTQDDALAWAKARAFAYDITPQTAHNAPPSDSLPLEATPTKTCPQHP